MSIQVCNVAAECFLSWQAPQQATYSDDAPDCAFLLIPSKFPSALHLHLLLLFMYPHQHAYWSLDPSQLLLRKPGCMGCQLLMFILLGSHKMASCMATGFLPAKDFEQRLYSQNYFQVPFKFGKAMFLSLPSKDCADSLANHHVHC